MAQASRNGVDEVDLFTAGSGGETSDQTADEQPTTSQGSASTAAAETEVTVEASTLTTPTAPTTVDGQAPASASSSIGPAETATTAATTPDPTTAESTAAESTAAEGSTPLESTATVDSTTPATGDTQTSDSVDTESTAPEAESDAAAESEPAADTDTATESEPTAESEPAADPAAAEPELGRDPFELALLALLAIAGLGTLVYLLWSLVRSLRASDDDDDPLDTELPIPALDPLLALDRLRRALETEPDPRQAIRRAYAAVESGFGRPDLARKVGETPYRFFDRTLRVIGSSTADDELVDSLATPLDRLTNLFLLARYSEHEITESMRNDAIGSVMTIRDRFRDAEAAAAEAVEAEAAALDLGDDRVPASL